MKKNLLAVLMIIFAVAIYFPSCDDDSSPAPEIIEIEGSYQCESFGAIMNITVSNTQYVADNPEEWSWDYSGNITLFSNDQDYLIAQITSHQGDETQINKFFKVVWSVVDATTIHISESTTQYDTQDEAIADATTDLTDAMKYSVFTKI